MKGKPSQPPLLLSEGNEGRFIRDNNTMSFVETSSTNQIAWKTKHLVFKDETLDNVVKRLEEVYLVKFRLSDNLKERRLNAVYHNQSVEHIIQILESTLNINIKETDKNVYEMVME
jgi:ferric-dicitrate binding protein FerR (iron transport regulator)